MVEYIKLKYVQLIITRLCMKPMGLQHAPYAMQGCIFDTHTVKKTLTTKHTPQEYLLLTIQLAMAALRHAT
jgi:hypothetical protein